MLTVQSIPTELGHNGLLSPLQWKVLLYLMLLFIMPWWRSKLLLDWTEHCYINCLQWSKSHIFACHCISVTGLAFLLPLHEVSVLFLQVEDSQMAQVPVSPLECAAGQPWSSGRLWAWATGKRWAAPSTLDLLFIFPLSLT